MPLICRLIHQRKLNWTNRRQKQSRQIKKAVSVVKNETKEEVKPELEDDSHSPVKISKSNKNRIISDSEDGSPVKKSPKKVEKESKPTFSIFQKKSPKKSEATPVKNEDKTPKSSSKSTPSSASSKKSPKKSPSDKKSPKKSSDNEKSAQKSPVKDKLQSPKKDTSKSPTQEVTPKPATSLGTPKQASKEKPKN